MISLTNYLYFQSICTTFKPLFSFVPANLLIFVFRARGTVFALCLLFHLANFKTKQFIKMHNFLLLLRECPGNLNPGNLMRI